MLNLLVSEMSGVLELLERHHLVQHVTVSAAVLTAPSEAVSEVVLSLLRALEEFRIRLEQVLVDQTMTIHYPAELTESHRSPSLRPERPDWSHQIPTKDEYFGRPTPLTFAKPDPSQEPPEAYSYGDNANLEALNLSVAASPECLEAMNLSVATSPCYNPIYETSHSRPFKQFPDVGPPGFWDVSLDNDPHLGTEPQPDCFPPEPAVVNQGIPGPADGFSIEFPQDMDSTSALGDGYILDISSNVNVSVTDALNASIYFDFHKDGSEVVHREAEEAASVSESCQTTGAVLDLSHPGPSVMLPAHPNFHYPLIAKEEFSPQQAESEEYCCSTCGKVLQSEKSLLRHEVAHDAGQLICDLCGRGFHEYWMLKRHVLTHISTHVCQTCGKRCVDKGKLRRHERTHFNPGLMCTLCRKEFDRSDNLSRHMNIVHGQSKEFVCPLCSKSFSTKCNLDQHHKTKHETTTLVKCESCGKTYKNNATYAVHAKTHGPPRYFCDVCPQTFYRLPLYRRHLKNAHAIYDIAI